MAHKILVVDDDAGIRDALRMILDYEGYEVLSASDGKAALDDLKGGSFTVTNIGALGGSGAIPIINYPEVAILGVARARQEHGIERTILQSTAQGFDLYRRMGYSVVTNVAVYTS